MANQPLLDESETIAAILPHYQPTGDCTSIFSAAGTCKVSPVGIRAILRRLARELAIDLSALKEQAGQATGQRILHILPLADDLVLVPVKVRTPQVNRDNCTGYINACCVASVHTIPPPYKSLVILQTGVEIPTLWTAATVERHLRAARLLIASHKIQLNVQPELVAISRKLVEVFQDILALKSR